MPFDSNNGMHNRDNEQSTQMETEENSNADEADDAFNLDDVSSFPEGVSFFGTSTPNCSTLYNQQFSAAMPTIEETAIEFNPNKGEITTGHITHYFSPPCSPQPALPSPISPERKTKKTQRFAAHAARSRAGILAKEEGYTYIGDKRKQLPSTLRVKELNRRAAVKGLLESLTFFENQFGVQRHDLRKIIRDQGGRPPPFVPKNPPVDQLHGTENSSHMDVDMEEVDVSIIMTEAPPAKKGVSFPAPSQITGKLHKEIFYTIGNAIGEVDSPFKGYRQKDADGSGGDSLVLGFRETKPATPVPSAKYNQKDQSPEGDSSMHCGANAYDQLKNLNVKDITPELYRKKYIDMKFENDPLAEMSGYFETLKTRETASAQKKGSGFSKPTNNTNQESSNSTKNQNKSHEPSIGRRLFAGPDSCSNDDDEDKDRDKNRRVNDINKEHYRPHQPKKTNNLSDDDEGKPQLAQGQRRRIPRQSVRKAKSRQSGKGKGHSNSSSIDQESGSQLSEDPQGISQPSEHNQPGRAYPSEGPAHTQHHLTQQFHMQQEQAQMSAFEALKIQDDQTEPSMHSTDELLSFVNGVAQDKTTQRTTSLDDLFDWPEAEVPKPTAEVLQPKARDLFSGEQDSILASPFEVGLIDEAAQLASVPRLVKPFSKEFHQKIDESLAVTQPDKKITPPGVVTVTRHDIGTILPQPGTMDDPSGWVNDEIIKRLPHHVGRAQTSKDRPHDGRSAHWQDGRQNTVRLPRLLQPLGERPRYFRIQQSAHLGSQEQAPGRQHPLGAKDPGPRPPGVQSLDHAGHLSSRENSRVPRQPTRQRRGRVPHSTHLASGRAL